MSRAERLVAASGVLPGLADERRVPRQSQDVDADRGIADVGIADRRTGLLVELTQPHAEFIGTARSAALDLGGIDEIGLVYGLRGRRHAAVVGAGRNGLVSRLAPHADEVLDRRADRLAVAG